MKSITRYRITLTTAFIVTGICTALCASDVMESISWQLWTAGVLVIAFAVFVVWWT